MHLKGLRALNVAITEKNGHIYCDARQYEGGEHPARLSERGCDRKPDDGGDRRIGINRDTQRRKGAEIKALADALGSMGADIRGAGSSSVTIAGSRPLKKGEFRPLPDRIAAGTFLASAAITGGDVTVRRVRPEHMRSVLAKLEECGCLLEYGDDSIRCIGPSAGGSTPCRDAALSGFPTDMQAMFMALCSVADGTSIIVENVFESRFRIAAELTCMGATITVKDRMAIVRGVDGLNGANVNACDLRAGAALVMAGLRATGVTSVSNAQIIDRGYEAIEVSLASLGANIIRTGGE
jgi:UDP-N-acetylglucosamine 1-carboxyvinyltransferase